MAIGNVAAVLVVAVAAVRGPQEAVDRVHVRAMTVSAISNAHRRRLVSCNSARRVKAAIRQRSRANVTASAVSVARDRTKVVTRVAHPSPQRVKRQRDNLPDREDSQDRKDAVATDAIAVGNIDQQISIRIRSAWRYSNRHRAVGW